MLARRGRRWVRLVGDQVINGIVGVILRCVESRLCVMGSGRLCCSSSSDIACYCYMTASLGGQLLDCLRPQIANVEGVTRTCNIFYIFDLSQSLSLLFRYSYHRYYVKAIFANSSPLVRTRYRPRTTSKWEHKFPKMPTISVDKAELFKAIGKECVHAVLAIPKTENFQFLQSSVIHTRPKSLTSCVSILVGNIRHLLNYNSPNM